MKNLFWYLLFLTVNVFSQVDYEFSRAEFFINQNGDSLFFPEPDSISKSSKFYFYKDNSEVQELRLLNNDTLLTIFSADGKKFHHYYKLRRAKQNESYNLYPLVILRDGTLLGTRENEYLLFVKGYSFFKNGNLRDEKIINSNTYRTYSFSGVLFSVADSCNTYLLPVGTYIQFDTLSNDIALRGKYIPCPMNQITCCEEGWWEFYNHGKLVSRKLYESGKLIEERNFH